MGHKGLLVGRIGCYKTLRFVDEYLLFALARNEILEEVDSEAVAVAEISLHVNGEEHIDLPLRAELGGKRRGSDGIFLGGTNLHDGKFVCLIL